MTSTPAGSASGGMFWEEERAGSRLASFMVQGRVWTGSQDSCVLQHFCEPYSTPLKPNSVQGLVRVLECAGRIAVMLWNHLPEKTFVPVLLELLEFQFHLYNNKYSLEFI